MLNSVIPRKGIEMKVAVLENADARVHKAEGILKATIIYLRKNGYIKESNELREAWTHINKIDWID